jgi:6-carboxyhexanoate--CoA ligase
MKNLWSIRMRASKSVGGLRSTVSGQKELHISGAEGLYKESEIQQVVKHYLERALHHPKGKADNIVITVEYIKQAPKIIAALPVTTVICETTAQGKTVISKILRTLGISEKALDTAFAVIKKDAMRGATIIASGKGNRLEPDEERGARVSRVGIIGSVSKRISDSLSQHGINTDTVKEALILASKVIFHKDVIAELCVSDDPDYTTGYVASKKFGYLRIPHIKRQGSKAGGRAFFVREGSDIPPLIHYLETMPVLIGKGALCKGTLAIHELINSPHR